MPRLDDTALDTIFRSARTYTSYTDEPLSDADLEAIWELMKYGPTSANLLPARIIWCRSQEAKDKLAALASEENAGPIRAAPATAIIGMDLKFYEHAAKLFPLADVRAWFEGTGTEHETAFRNSTLQGGYFIIAARALGFDAGPMSGFHKEGVDQAFFANTSFETNFLCTVGHGDKASLHERMPRPPFTDFNSVV